MEDWAEMRARGWLAMLVEAGHLSYECEEHKEDTERDLAALLRETGQREWDLGHSAAINAMSGHKPDCGGVDLSENRCECGWLESRSGTEATAREQTLAEVRRVVITVRDGWMRGEVGVAVPPPPDDITKTCDQILLRLESL